MTPVPAGTRLFLKSLRGALPSGRAMRIALSGEQDSTYWMACELTYLKLIDEIDRASGSLYEM